MIMPRCFEYRHPPARRETGFSLIELLVVIAIIAILAALAFPLTKRMIEAGHTGKATANLRQIGALLASYAADNNNCLPVLIRWDNMDNTWWQRVVSEHAGFTVKPPKGLDPRLPDIFYDPAVGKGSHPYGDFGGNQAIMPDYNPWVTGGIGPNARGTSLSSIGPLSKKVIVASAEIPSGVPCKGSWYINKDWITSGGATGATPANRHGGKALCLFADGHTEALDTENMSASDRRKYFTRDEN
jgi:prepilin-type N-terminal cleavage/methylation domain-containing protein/prepilin-type processing-associated H-X9-DG protein